FAPKVAWTMRNMHLKFKIYVQTSRPDRWLDPAVAGRSHLNGSSQHPTPSSTRRVENLERRLPNQELTISVTRPNQCLTGKVITSFFSPHASQIPHSCDFSQFALYQIASNATCSSAEVIPAFSIRHA